MQELITYEKQEHGYGVITLNRTKKRNAISLEMADLLMNKLSEAKTDQLKFLVISGGDSSMFCAGGDLRDLHGELSAGEAFTRLGRMLDVLLRIIHFPVPVIAELNGDALGGGCELATACDIRIAKEGTKFGFIQTKIGILPGWGGGALLYKKVDPSFAFNWLMSGSTLSASELKEKGWLHHIIEEGQWESRDYLAPYFEKSQEQLRLLKAQYISNIQVDELHRHMVEESRSSAGLWESEMHRQALDEFSKRKT